MHHHFRSVVFGVLTVMGAKAIAFDSMSTTSITSVGGPSSVSESASNLPFSTPTDVSISATPPFSTPTSVISATSEPCSSSTSVEVAFSTVDFTFTFIPVSTVTVTTIFCPYTQSSAISCPCITECPTASTSATPITFTTPDTSFSSMFSVAPTQSPTDAGSASSEISTSFTASF